jgi:hypothetical protein
LGCTALFYSFIALHIGSIGKESKNFVIEL